MTTRLETKDRIREEYEALCTKYLQDRWETGVSHSEERGRIYYLFILKPLLREISLIQKHHEGGHQ